MKDSQRLSRGTALRPQKFTPEAAEAKLISILEKRIAELERSNAKLLRLVEMAMEERFYRPTITGGVRKNELQPSMPLESLNDVAVFDEQADSALMGEQGAQFAELEKELNAIETEHRDWRARKGVANEETPTPAAVA
jgi:hypothetical protein